MTRQPQQDTGPNRVQCGHRYLLVCGCFAVPCCDYPDCFRCRIDKVADDCDWEHRKDQIYTFTRNLDPVDVPKRHLDPHYRKITLEDM
jgi:hypothetical protein